MRAAARAPTGAAILAAAAARHYAVGRPSEPGLGGGATEPHSVQIDDTPRGKPHSRQRDCNLRRRLRRHHTPSRDTPSTVENSALLTKVPVPRTRSEGQPTRTGRAVPPLDALAELVMANERMGQPAATTKPHAESHVLGDMSTGGWSSWVAAIPFAARLAAAVSSGCGSRWRLDRSSSNHRTDAEDMATPSLKTATQGTSHSSFHSALPWHISQGPPAGSHRHRTASEMAPFAQTPRTTARQAPTPIRAASLRELVTAMPSTMYPNQVARPRVPRPISHSPS